MTALYEIAQIYRTDAEHLADLDLPPEVVADTLSAMSGDLDVKAQNVVFAARNMEALAVSIKAAETAMATRRKALENRAEHLRSYVLNCMQLAGVQKITSPYFTIAQRENPPSVVIDAADLIPAKYMRQPEPPPPAPDKKALADAIKAGEDVPGVHLERGVRLEIR